MTIVQILYIILGASIVVLTVTIVWLANEAIGLIKSIRRSSENTEVVTVELKDKVMMVSEALDRVGSAASTMIGLIEDGTEAIKGKRDHVVDSIALVAGTGKHITKKSADDEIGEQAEESKNEEKPKEKKNGKK